MLSGDGEPFWIDVGSAVGGALATSTYMRLSQHHLFVGSHIITVPPALG